MAARTWSAAADNANWSANASWDGGASVPTSGDTVTFNNTSVHTCNVDNIGTFNGTITVASTYSGTITQTAAVSGVSTTLIQGGTWAQAGFSFSTTGNASVTISASKTWSCGSTATINLGTGTFTNNGAFSYSGTLTITGSLTIGASSTNVGSSTPALAINQSLNISATASSWTSVNVLCNGTTATTYTDTGAKNSGTWTVNKSAAANFTVAASTSMSIGATAVSNLGTGTLTVTGTLNYSGLWTHTGAISTGASSTVTGSSSPSLAISGSVTLNSGGTWTSVNILTNGTDACTYTDTGAKNTGTWTITKSAAANVIVAASTIMALGASPTCTINAATLTVTGTVTVSVAWTINGALTISSGGTVSGALTSLTIDRTLNISATSTWPTGVNVTINWIISRTFSGGNMTFGTLTINATTAAMVVTIANSNTFTTFTDNAGLAAHTLTFTAGTTQTAGQMLLSGTPGNVLTINSSSSGSAATLSSAITVVMHNVSVKDITANLFPKWYAWAGATNVSGNTNIIFNQPPSGVGGQGGGYGTYASPMSRGRGFGGFRW